METKITPSGIEILKELYAVMGIPFSENFESEASDILSNVSKAKKLIDRDMCIIVLQTKLEVAYLQKWLCHPRKKPRKINRFYRQIKSLQEESDNDELHL